MPKLTVRRGGSTGDALRRYKVFVDGEVVARLRPNKQVELDVSPGAHEIQLKLDWAKSKPLTVDTSSGDVQVVCEKPKDAPAQEGAEDWLQLSEE